MHSPREPEQTELEPPEIDPRDGDRQDDPPKDETAFFKGSSFGIETEAGEDAVLEDLLSAFAEIEAERQKVAPKRRDARRRAIEKSRFVVPARSAALGAVVIAVICLVSLVLVAESKSANALATLALALALLSFVIQVMVFVYQSQTSHQQMLQAEQLYTETRALLTEVRTAANSTEKLVRDQFQDLLKAFMEAAPGSGEGEPFDSAAFERRLVDALRTEIRDPQETQAANPRPAAAALTRARAQRDRRRRELVNELLTFPEEPDGKQALKTLQSLSPAAVKRLNELITDELRLRRNDRPGILGLKWTDIDEELRSADLVTKARVRANGNRVFVARVSDEGRVAGRLLIATGEVPDYAVDGIPDLPDSGDGITEGD